MHEQRHAARRVLRAAQPADMFSHSLGGEATLDVYRFTGESRMDLTGKVALVCEHIVKAERPIKLVVHHSDGDWQFACGEYDHADDGAGAGGVCISHLIARQPDLQSCLDLKPGLLAEHSADGWTRSAHDD